MILLRFSNTYALFLIVFREAVFTNPVKYLNEFIVALAAFVGDAGEVGVAFLAVFADNFAVVELVLFEESLGVVVRVDVDLGQRVVRRRVLRPLVHPRLQPRRQQLQPELDTLFISGKPLRRTQKKKLEG